jgi:hypothetical protein
MLQSCNLALKNERNTLARFQRDNERTKDEYQRIKTLLSNREAEVSYLKARVDILSQQDAHNGVTVSYFFTFSFLFFSFFQFLRGEKA